MEEFNYEFPQNFTGRITIKQNSKFQNIETELVCGSVLTILAQSNDWQKKLSVKEIYETLITNGNKITITLFQDLDNFVTAIKKIIKFGDIKILESSKEENAELFFIATPILTETMKEYGQYQYQ